MKHKIHRYLKAIVYVFAILPIVVFGHNKVVVVPMAGDDLKPLKNVITVAKANGDFTDPVAAVNSINDASANNPYLVVIAPGVYTISDTLVMKEYVDIAGSGENITILSGSIASSSIAASALVVGANNSRIADLTIINTGGGTNVTGIYIQASPSLVNLTINVSGGSANNSGIYLLGNSTPTMDSLTINVSGINATYGILSGSNSSELIQLSNSVISVSGDGNNSGIALFVGKAIMENLSVTCSGGVLCFGISVSDGSVIMNSNISVTGATNKNEGVSLGGTSQLSGLIIDADGASLNQDYAVRIASGAPIIRHSYIEGSNFGLFISNGTPNVSHSSVLNGANNTNAICTFVDDGVGNVLDANCQ